MTNPRTLRWLASLGLVLLASCSDPASTSPSLTSISATPSTISLGAGRSRRITVAGSYSDGSVVPVTASTAFSSTVPAVATVSADGLVVGVSGGSTTVIASLGGKTAAVEVEVSAAPVTLASIAITPATLDLLVGRTQALSVVGTFSDGSSAALASGVTFASSVTSVATVSGAGVVTAVSAGNTVITATSQGKSDTVVVTVTAPVPTLTSIAVAPASVSLAVAATRQLAVTGTFSDASTTDLTGSAVFESTVPSVATVSAGGLVTAVAAGSTTINITASGKTTSAAVTVTSGAPTLSSIAVAPSSVSLAVGATRQLAVTGTFSDASTSDLTGSATFSSTAAGVATVSAGGLVTAVAGGSATIDVAVGGKTAAASVTVVAATTTGGVVFSDDFDVGVSFAGFGGAANDVARDPTEIRPGTGRASLKAVITGAGNFSGGALVAAVPRDLSAFNALTFWAKASVANTLNVTGIGDNAFTNPPPFKAEVLAFPLTSAWAKYVIPLPDPAKLVGSDGLFHFADGPKNYTIWFSDIQYESLPAGEVDAPTGATINWPTSNLAVGATSQIDPAPNTVVFTTPALPTGGSLKNVSFRWFTLTSDAPGIASVNQDGLVTGVSGGTAHVTATLRGAPVAGSGTFTVTAPLAVPATIAAAPTLPAGNVISLFGATYPSHGVDTWRTDWSTCCNALVDPFVIAGHDVKQYDLHHFVGVEFGIANVANTVDATAMTHFHVDIWSPNPPGRLQIQLVQDPGPAAAVGVNEVIAPAGGTWVSLDIPLSSFGGLTAKDKIRQMLFLALDAGGANSAAILYVDNVYFHN